MGSFILYAKGTTDMIFILAVILIYFSEIFTYLDSFHVDLTSIRYEISSSIIVGIAGSSDFQCEDFDIYGFSFCEDSKNWVHGGIFFYIFSILSIFLSILSIFATLSLILDKKIKCLKNQLYHFLYPIIYTIGLLGYLYISNVYNLSTYNQGEKYEMKAKIGLILMQTCEGIALLSILLQFLLYFPCMSSLHEPLLS